MSGGARVFAMSMGATTTNQGSSQLPCSGVTDSWTVYGYARVSRGRDDGTDPLQNQRLRLTGTGVDDAHIHQDIITSTVSHRPGLNDLLNVVQTGDVLMVIARPLDRLGRDTLSLLELRVLECWLTPRTWPVVGSWSLWSPPKWRPSSGQHQPVDEAGAGAGPGGGQAGGAGASRGRGCALYNG